MNNTEDRISESEEEDAQRSSKKVWGRRFCTSTDGICDRLQCVMSPAGQLAPPLTSLFLLCQCFTTYTKPSTLQTRQ